MSYLCQKCKKLGVTDFVSEINRVENYPDFEQLAYVIQHGLKEFIVIHFTIIHQRGGEQYLTNHRWASQSARAKSAIYLCGMY